MQEYLLRATQPDVAFIEGIKALLSELPIEDGKKAPQGKILLVTGSLEEVINQLADSLIEDYRSNLAEDESAYKFEYVVTAEGFGKAELAVLTRLYSDVQPGSILYGNIIKKEGPKNFSLWVDPE